MSSEPNTDKMLADAVEREYGQDEAPEIECWICNETFVQEDPRKVVHDACWCDTCGTPKYDCPGECAIHKTHLTNVGPNKDVCEECDNERRVGIFFAALSACNRANEAIAELNRFSPLVRDLDLNSVVEAGYTLALLHERFEKEAE